MTFKHTDLEIPNDSPFSNCKLDREQYANVLTSVIENYPEGFVLAINNKWGTGKSTFIRMWEQSLKNSDYNTIYFNAWENDFEDNPLTAFIGELQIINKNENENFNKVVKNAALISKNVVPAIIKAAINKYIDSDTLAEAISDTSKSVLEIFEHDIEEYSKRKKSISDFRKSLSEFVANESNGKPLIFIVDELDRCRPNYAVLLLEQIKHFFSVPNIVFILSIDKLQLGNAICGVYGSENIDSNEYLRRFIDIEYSIPDPENGKFFDYLYQYFEFDSFFRAPERNQYNNFQYERDTFTDTCKVLISSLTLRQQEKILSHTRITLRTLNYNNYLFPGVFVFLIYSKTVHPEFYQMLSSKSHLVIDIQKEYYRIIEPFITDDTNRLFVQIEAYLLKFYSNFKSDNRMDNEIFEWNFTTKEFKAKIASKIDNDHFLNILNNRNNRDYFDLKLSHLINKLNLTESIKIN